MSVTTVSARDFARDLARAKRAAESGPVIVTARAPSLSDRRVIVTSLPLIAADSDSSSRSGSFIIQCARRRSSSCCGPPPSNPRAHSQA